MKDLIKIISLILFTLTATTAGAIWNDPASEAPNENASTTINISSSGQIKTGGVSLGSLIVSGGTTLGDTAFSCDVSTDGLIRFNNGVLQICSDENQLEPITATTTQPLLPASCSIGEVAVYSATSSTWGCGDAPQPLPECNQGQLLIHSATSSTWACSDGATSKFISGNDPSQAVFNGGKTGIGTDTPQAYLHVENSNDLSETSVNHAVRFGDSSALNLGISGSEIMVINNGVATALNMQANGGRVSVHDGTSSASKVHFAEDGRVVVGGDYDSDTTGKLLINNTSHQGPNSWYTSIKFTNGSHNAIWNPAGGLYFGLHSNGNFYWGDESGGAHQSYPMQLDSNSGDLVKNGDLTANALYLRGGVFNFDNQNMRIEGNGTQYFDFHSDNSDTSQIIFRDKQDVQLGRIHGSGNGSNIGLIDGDGHWTMLAVKDNRIELRVNNSEKMRIDSNGDVSIGVGDPSYRLDVEGDSTGYVAYFRNQSTDTAADGLRLTMNVSGTLFADDHFASFRDNAGNLHGSIGGRNNATQVLFWSASDGRLKENIKDINYDFAKGVLFKSRPVSFEWNRGDVKDLGYIAQELKPVLPGAVVGEENKFEITEDEDGNKERVPLYMTVEKDALIPFVHAGVKGAYAETLVLERKIAQEQEEIKNLEGKLLIQQTQLQFIAEKLK